MPAKKQGKNAFFFYMLEVQAEMQRKSGRKIPMKDMPAVAGPRWSVSATCCQCRETRTASRVSDVVKKDCNGKMWTKYSQNYFLLFLIASDMG